MESIGIGSILIILVGVATFTLVIVKLIKFYSKRKRLKK